MRNSNTLQLLYVQLYRFYGPQQWWPAQTKLEIIVGAVLTQNTAWANVEKAIANLKRHKVLTIKKLLCLSDKKLAQLIRPAGYYTIKTKRLKSLLRFIATEYRGRIDEMAREPLAVIRRKLLAVHGVGEETADSIILYALEKTQFVVDAYTKRIFARHKFIRSDTVCYQDTQTLCMRNLKRDAQLFNEYHALLVRLAKDYCKKRAPLCAQCPAARFLPRQQKHRLMQKN